MNTDTATANKSWTRSEIEVALREILVDALAVDEAKVVSEASLVNDLGAESIDFLDIGFRNFSPPRQYRSRPLVGGTWRI